MKRIALYLFALFLSGQGCSKNEVPSDCIGESSKIGCPYILDPVCGCNAVTYGNACLAKAAGVKYFVKGECK